MKRIKKSISATKKNKNVPRLSATPGLFQCYFALMDTFLSICFSMQREQQQAALQSDFLKSTASFPRPDKMEIYNGKKQRWGKRMKILNSPLKLPQLNFSPPDKRLWECDRFGVIWTESPLQSVSTPASPGGAVPSAFLIGFSLPAMLRPPPPAQPLLVPASSLHLAADQQLGFCNYTRSS